MKELIVLLNQEIIGVLAQNDHGTRSFTYLEGSDPTLEVSLALPYRAAPYKQRIVDPFINGLLPEGLGVREALGKAFEVSPENPFGLLEHIGLECAGAIQFVHPDELEQALSNSGDLLPCTEKDIGDRLRSLVSEPKGSWIVNRERWSLAGAQSKFALRWDNGWYEAEGAEPTTHIVKPGISDFRDQALNEHLSLKILGKAGLTVANSTYQMFDGEPALVVERYDRFVSDGRVQRIHQEDFCQATSTPPKNKYESDKGPTALKIIKTMRDAGVNEEEVLRFVEGLIGNYLIGAPDAHAKNYSLLLLPGAITLAPFYDIASGLPYTYKDEYNVVRKKDGLERAAMAIGGERRFGRVALRNWERFAADAALDIEWLLSAVRLLATSIPAAMEGVFFEEADAIGGSELPKRLREPLINLCESTLTLLDR